MKKTTIEDIQNLKRSKTPFSAITAYDYTSARLIDQAEIPIILVGDSAAMVVFGYENTIPITMNEMIFLVSSVSRGAQKALVVADMPFLSYQVSSENAILNAGRFIKESGAGAVKLEGGKNSCEKISAIVSSGIPVVGHIGLTPQSFHQMSGYKVQGKTKESVNSLIKDAQMVEAAGAFALVLEGIPAEVGKIITNLISIPTIGIGAGAHCDGQIQVFHDILGLFGTFVPKHTKQYGLLGEKIVDLISKYKKDVELRKFPLKEHSSHLKKEIFDSIDIDE